MLSLGLGINKNVKIFNGILDEIGNAGNAKYIFSPYKRLISSFEGNLVKVQRSSDYTSKWFGYDGNGDLKTSELLTWVGVGNDGLVEEVTNQVDSNFNAIQTTLSYKPKIVVNGNLESNGILFNGANTRMYCTNDGLENTKDSFSLFCKIYNLQDGNRRILTKIMSGGNYSYSISGRVGYYWEVVRTTNNSYIGINNAIANELNDIVDIMLTYDGSILQRFKDDSTYPDLSGTDEMQYDNTYNLEIGMKENSEFFNGNVKTIIFFDNNQASNYDDFRGEV